MSNNVRYKDEKAHVDHIEDGLSEKMLAFKRYNDSKFPNTRYTSGKREASNKVGHNHKTSHHNTGNALDVGSENDELYDYYMNTREGLSFLVTNGIGIIDETDPGTKGKTGATGDHYHFGMDATYVDKVKKRLENFDKESPNLSYAAKKRGYQSKYFGLITPQEVKDATTNGEVFYNPQIAMHNSQVDSFIDEVETETAKDQILETNPKLKQLVDKEDELIKQLSSAFQADNQPQQRSRDNRTEQLDAELAHALSQSQSPITVQTDLPDMPTIFKI